jgi:erythronate-4-phosphate dehydrogenase
MHILADENIPGLESLFDDTVEITRRPGREISPTDLGNVDALLVRSVTQVNQRLLQGSGVRFVGTATSGTDHIDRGYLQKEGIGFTYAPGSNANSVVEYVLACIAAVDDVLERLFSGGTVGIVGYGHIGKQLASRLEALGIAHKVFDPWLDQDTVSNPADLYDILQCEVVSLHCELTTQQPWPSHHLIGAAELRSIPADSLLINASRGAVVDNLSLLRLLAERDSQSVVLDVWETEPDINPALLESVTIGSAHIAGYSYDGKLLASRMLAEAAAEHFNMPVPDGDSNGSATLTLDDSGTGSGLVRSLLQASYDILYDDALLRGAVIGAGAVEVRENFDQLRKHYRVRRELRGSLVKSLTLSSSDLILLRALGCKHEQIGS